MRVMNVIDEILLLIHPNSAGKHIMHIISADDNIMQMIFPGRTPRHGHVDAGIPVHALIYIPVPSVLPLYVENFTVFNHDSLRDPLRLSADADSLPHAALFCPVGHRDVSDLPEAHTLQVNSRIRTVSMNHGSRFFIRSFRLPISVHRYGTFPASGSFGAERSVPASAPFQTHGVSGLELLPVGPFQCFPCRFRRQTRSGIIAVFIVDVKGSFCVHLLSLPSHSSCRISSPGTCFLSIA